MEEESRGRALDDAKKEKQKQKQEGTNTAICKLADVASTMAEREHRGDQSPRLRAHCADNARLSWR